MKKTKAGEVGVEIVGLDVQDLIARLRTAYADEWMAYYQYWVGSQVMVGGMRKSVETELLQHADDEKDHAGQIATRIIQLGGIPVLDPADWKANGHCGFTAPVDPSVREILKNNIDGEQCAIRFYQDLLNLVRGKDDVTFDMIQDILADEVEHEEDLKMLTDDADMGLDGRGREAAIALRIAAPKFEGKSPEEYAALWGSTQGQGAAHFYNYGSKNQVKDAQFYKEFLSGRGGIKDTLQVILQSLNAKDGNFNHTDWVEMGRFAKFIEDEAKRAR